MQKFTEFFTTITLSLLGGIYSAWLFTFLWTWYITSQFGIKSPSLFGMWGILLIIQLIKEYKYSEEIDSFSEFMKKLFYKLIYITFGFGFGWVIHFFI